MAHLIKENIAKILALDGNNKCGDCGMDVDGNNGWASMTYGIVICVECAGVHRGIAGNQIRSFLLDTKAWKNDTNVDFLSKIGGNKTANNNVWECHLPNFYINLRSVHDDLRQLSDKDKIAKYRNLFIRNKYERQLFVPLSSSEYFTNKNVSMIKVPIPAIKSHLIYFYNLDGKQKWHKKALFGLIHSYYFSIYANQKIKKKKCTHLKTYNLLENNVQISINNVDEYDDDDNYYEFQLVEERKDDTNVILRARIAEFRIFVRYVHEIRKAINYFTMYSQLTDIASIETYPPSLDINYNQFNTNKTFIGFGKLFACDKNNYFYVSGDRLYTFKQDPLSQIGNNQIDGNTVIVAKNGWNLQKIDIKQDISGERTGINYGIVIIEPHKIISVKCENDKIAMSFYLKLYSLWANIRGNFYVDFKPQIPRIIDERKEDSYSAPPGSPRAHSPIPSSPNSTAVHSLSFDKFKGKPQILEILANINKEELQQQQEVFVGLPPPVPIDEEDDETFVQMQAMHRRMSTHAQQIYNYEADELENKKNVAELPKLDEHNECDGDGGAVGENVGDDVGAVTVAPDLPVPPPFIEFEPMADDIPPPAPAPAPAVSIPPAPIKAMPPPPPRKKRVKSAGKHVKNVKRNEVKAQDIEGNNKNVKQQENKEAVMDNLPPSLIQSKSYDEDEFGAAKVAVNQNENINKKKKSKLNDKWLCKMCTYSNDMNVHKCTICGAAKQKSHPQPNVNVSKQQNAANPSGGTGAAAEPEPEPGGGGPGGSAGAGGQGQGAHAMQNSGHGAVGNNMNMNMYNMMFYHQQLFQKYFQQQQYPQNLTVQQQQQIQQMANYHYQQYTMLYQQQQQQQQQRQYQQQQQQQQQQQYQQPKQQQQRLNVKQNINKKLLQKRKSGITMQYIKLERYFVMNESQKNSLSVNLFVVQQSLGQYASIQIAQNIGCYKLSIPANVPLPERKGYWQKILQMTRNCIGMSMEHIV